MPPIRWPGRVAIAVLLASVAACSDASDPVSPQGDGGPNETVETNPNGDGTDGGGADAAPDTSKCADGVRNGSETDVDCGGDCKPCGQCARCTTGSDCASAYCESGTCTPLPQDFPELDPTRRELRKLLTSIESGMRCDMDIYYDVLSIVGREGYRFSEKETRYTSELLGEATSELHGDAFYIARPWATRYWVAGLARRLMKDSIAALNLADSERNGYVGVARTLIAYELLLNLNLSDSNGLRVDLDDMTQPAKSKSDALAFISTLLDGAKTDLTNATFTFPLPSGFDDLSDVAGFRRFNRALAARVAAYREQWPTVLTCLNESFFDLNGDLSRGAYLGFSDFPGDIRNPLFLSPNGTSEARLAHPSFSTDIVGADARIAKTALRTNPASRAGLSSTRDVTRYASENAPIPIIRNEELVLLYAEAKVRQNQFPDAIVSINRIRTAHNLPPYAGAVTSTALLAEVLHQRRYSLFYEGHRWIDLRRHGKLNELPLDRAGDDVWSAFPIPANDGAP